MNRLYPIYRYTCSRRPTKIAQRCGISTNDSSRNIDSGRIRTWLVDAFTNRPFTGNPAEIVYLPSMMRSAFSNPQMELWMKQMAAESHVPVSAFLMHLMDADYAIRWFTPTKELELCGHGTITAAHVLYDELREVTRSKPIRFHTKFNGIITASTTNSSTNLHYGEHTKNDIYLEFPNTRLATHNLSPTDMQNFVQAFSLPSTQYLQSHLLYTGKSIYDIVLRVSPELFHRLPYDSARLDFSSLAKVETQRGIIVTTSEHPSQLQSNSCQHTKETSSSLAQSSTAFDFIHRMFLPRFGIPEDHVSGSGFCALTEYWQQQLNYDKDHVLIGYQKSPRGGTVTLQQLKSTKKGAPSDEYDAIRLGGQCVTTKSGFVHILPPFKPEELI